MFRRKTKYIRVYRVMVGVAQKGAVLDRVVRGDFSEDVQRLAS